ncbi:GNAT family N-acetyltransferase [Pedobacter psychroterrae]|uniref:N-acetyltransferase n=1 Tax=Pedobacter psychroterrae TaxID=2530453 RepID=A0A4R0NSS8_9SPHI|nr:GNAT family N-acetyltransferase [Pedobacter psychroterrae]TCD03158.1 N-acetyltransferase [Pedobacter psychroterrae]
MRNATLNDKSAVVRILSQSFQDNKSVNYIVRQDERIVDRIRGLMEYSFHCCLDFGRVFIAEDGNACALVLFPDRKRTSLSSILRDLKLVFKVIGLGALLKVIRRESLIKRRYTASREVYYLWFIGVLPEWQGRGSGTQLIEEVLLEASRMNRPVYLETSTERNLSWYGGLGFELYDQLDLGYQLYFFRKRMH